MDSDRDRVVGVVEGDISVTKFKFRALTEDIGLNDYVEVEQDGESYVAIVTNLHRTPDSIVCECNLIGLGPRKPLPIGATVYRVSEDNLRKSLGLTADEKRGIYIGRLIGYGCKVYLPVKGMGRIFIVGKPGSGKSYTVGVIVEEFLKKGIPVVIIDPHGEYSSLKIPGSPPPDSGIKPRSYVDQVLEFGDPQINPGVDLGLDALKVADPEDLVVSGQCTIINLRGIVEERQVEIVSEVLDKLFQASITRRIKPFYCFMDEAHRFAGKERRSTTEFVKRFAQEGRKFGANLVVVTQRPQLLDTTVRGLVGTWIIHRVTDPNDLRIVLESGGLGRKWEEIIQWLDKGEAVVTGEVVEKVPILVKIRARETMHGAPGFNPLDFAEPELRDRIAERIRDTKKRLLSRRRVEHYWNNPPDVTPDLPQCFLAASVKPEDVTGKIVDVNPHLNVELSDYTLEYKPALEYEVEAQVNRRDPKISFRCGLSGFTPLVEGFDFKRREAYGLTLDDLSSVIPSTEPPLEGRYVKPSIDLSERGFKRLIRGLKINSSLRLARVVFYHTGLGYVSQVSDKKKFMEECREEAKRLIEEEVKRELDNLQKFLEDIREDSRRREEFLMKSLEELKELEKNVKKLKSELAKARKSRRPLRRLKSMITSRERRIRRLKKRISVLEHEIEELKNYEETLLQEWNSRIDAIRDKYMNLEKAAVRSYVIQPTSRELKITLLQLVWVPVFKAVLKVSNGDLETAIGIHWNGVNGKGLYGECAECGITIREPTGLILCAVCLKPICGEHRVVCERCGKPVCPTHSWRCEICGRTLCDDEEKYLCGICFKTICEDCVAKCIVCGEDTVYCVEDVVECPHCGLTFCRGHFKEHLTWCEVCGEETCQNSSYTCSVCGKTLCESCAVECSICGEKVCPDHLWVCNVCGRSFCISEEKNLCEICGKPVCVDDTFVCPSCGRTVGRIHVVRCPNCGAEVCEECLVSRRRGLFKKRGCRLCLGG